MQKTKTFSPPLFYYKGFINSYRDRNVLIGDIFEEFTKNLLKLRRLSVNCTEEVCPDLVNQDKSVFVEAKAGREDNGIAIKKEQYEYYKDFVDLHFPSVYDLYPVFKIKLYYAFWIYNDIDLDRYKKEESIQEVLSQNVKCLYTIPLDNVWELLKDKHATICYRIRLKDLISRIDQMLPKKFTVSTEAYSFKTNTFDWYSVV